MKSQNKFEKVVEFDGSSTIAFLAVITFSFALYLFFIKLIIAPTLPLSPTEENLGIGLGIGAYIVLVIWGIINHIKSRKVYWRKIK